MSTANPLKPSERMKIPRQEPIEQDPAVRTTNFLEVSFGFDEDRSIVEAKRCLDCKNPLCIDGCPGGHRHPGIHHARHSEGLMSARSTRSAKRTISRPSAGVSVPRRRQCEELCVLGKKLTPVAIGKLERFVADYEMRENLFTPPAITVHRDEKVAIVGSGPAGLTCAAELARMGYQVTVFEALHAVGGVLRYGIPEFRLPKEILDIETERIKALGVQIHTNFVIGRTATIDELFDEWGFKAIFLATGAGTPTFMGIPGENLSGVYSANEFLTRVNLMGAYRFPEVDTPIRIGKKVAVIGGGNTAMDAVRTAKRLGAEHAYLIYRRSR